MCHSLPQKSFRDINRSFICVLNTLTLISSLLDLKMTTRRRKRRRKMMRKRRSTTVRSPSQSWNHGVVGAWSETLACASSQQEMTAVRRKRKVNMTCTGMTVTRMVPCFIKMKTQMRMKRMSHQLVIITPFCANMFW